MREGAFAASRRINDDSGEKVDYLCARYKFRWQFNLEIRLGIWRPRILCHLKI